jgi:hypothetical protein
VFEQLIQSLGIAFRKVLLQQKATQRERNYGTITLIIFLVLHLPSTESNADDEELPTGIHQAFKSCNFRTDTIDMDELFLAVKSLSSDKACGLDEVVTQIL